MAQIDTKADLRENANTVASCINPTDVWHLQGAAQDVGKLIILKGCAEVSGGKQLEKQVERSAA